MLETIRRSRPRHLQQSMSSVAVTPGEPRPMIDVQLEYKAGKQLQLPHACAALQLLHMKRCLHPTPKLQDRAKPAGALIQQSVPQRCSPEPAVDAAMTPGQVSAPSMATCPPTELYWAPRHPRLVQARPWLCEDLCAAQEGVRLHLPPLPGLAVPRCGVLTHIGHLCSCRRDILSTGHPARQAWLHRDHAMEGECLQPGSMLIAPFCKCHAQGCFLCLARPVDSIYAANQPFSHYQSGGVPCCVPCGGWTQVCDLHHADTRFPTVPGLQRCTSTLTLDHCSAGSTGGSPAIPVGGRVPARIPDRATPGFLPLIALLCMFMT